MFKNSRIKAAPKVVRTEQAPVAKKPQPLPSKIAFSARRQQQIARSNASSLRSSPAISNRSSPLTSPSEDHELSSRHLQVPKRKPIRQSSPSDRPKFDESDDDEDDSTSFEQPAQKRQKVQDKVGRKRQLRSWKAFSDGDGGKFKMIHAAEIVAPLRKPKAVADTSIEDVIVELQYPSASQRERYDLHFGKDRIDSVGEIIEIAKVVTEVYLTDKQADPFLGQDNGKVIRELEKARNTLRKEPTQSRREDFKKAVDDYNTAIQMLIQDGALAKNLDNRYDLPLKMVQLILKQVYDRAVSPDVDSLRKYEAGSDNVYGELLSPLVDRIFDKTKITSDQVFVDLGSGVGNVVLQAALQIGCESWGCEMAPNACKLAKAQKKEFKARCRLWGIATGEVHLVADDFTTNRPIQDAMKRADVILVNNEVFSSELNHTLNLLFLDCKDDCKIVSLKSFVPEGHQITARNIGNPANVLDVKKLQYYRGDVSWTDAGGDYYIATKDSQRLADFER
ncbi:Histone-lysine N-methyltransferase,H3 lysine-79 specific [Lachnellula hyalina]|uniref:Histone-lysine N-methyltransferase, H3 lysine-79 specific n=1 Tax=Lachnellula hyalina TaxID=1316788 RepID=A0A8H8TY30_9HELO|nr:Histone-lysine N-methyltransferase,H3 lysine-79 specific [Lachnellula hyalina]TVY24940.1 Histone-lysine N-methyltransferase,H3 lysine-79 specific [Lachnellula hyalina]